MLMYFVYILFSEKCNRFYVGYTYNVEARLERHNSGLVAATKNCIPYRLCIFKQFETQQETIAEERRIKKQKSRKYIEWLIQGNWNK